MESLAKNACKRCAKKSRAICTCGGAQVLPVVIPLPTGHVHQPERASDERASIVKYLDWAASVEIGSVLTQEQREGVAYAAAWVRNRLDLEASNAR